MADERYRIIMVRQMVTHSSKLPDVDDCEWNKPQYDEDALERYVRSLSNLKLDSAPPRTSKSGKPSLVGISWFLDEYRGNKMISHGGGDTGFLTTRHASRGSLWCA
jgi:hypothetical protein